VDNSVFTASVCADGTLVSDSARYRSLAAFALASTGQCIAGLWSVTACNGTLLQELRSRLPAPVSQSIKRKAPVLVLPKRVHMQAPAAAAPSYWPVPDDTLGACELDEWCDTDLMLDGGDSVTPPYPVVPLSVPVRFGSMTEPSYLPSPRTYAVLGGMGALSMAFPF
jgi:hypothetical protein